jgi:cysteinyl-tRNA synthetase
MSMKYLGATFDMHGGGMDLLFPHHENELAQSESATGQPLARYWMHNGLTRIKTKLSSGEWADEKMSGSIGNVVSAAELLQQYGAETLRYMLLSTQYRRPIEFSDDAVTSARKAMATFIRLAERIDRLTARPPRGDEPDMDAMALRMLETEQAPFVRAILAQKMRFLEMMDDDFNTAGAIAVLHEIASDINSFLEQNRAEATRPADVVQLAAGAVATLQNLGRIIGLFRTGLRQADAPKQPDLAANLVGLLIQLRNEARQSKNFKLSDGIRDGLAKLGVVLEDRPDGTGWRRQ